MSDEDEQQTSSNKTNFCEINNRRLSTIKAKLQELTREKTKYNVEKLTQDADFIQSEIVNLSHDIADLNKEINAQIANKKALNTKIAILRSNSSLRYTNSKMALRDKERYEKELEKANKTEAYRDLARQKIKSICEALPQLEKQDEYHLNLKQADEKQILAQHKREKLQESLNAKSRKQTEIRQLLNDGSTKLPELETAIENLRLERTQITDLLNQTKSSRRRSTNLQERLFPSPVPSFRSLEQDTLEHEKQQANNQLEKIRLLLKYFHEKMSEHNLTQPTKISVNRSNSLTANEEQSILTSFMDEKDPDETTQHAIAMKLPRNFNSTTNEIIHSNDNLYQYKKELPNDILNKYAGVNNRKQPIQQNKKNKKNKKNFSIKHQSQMISLYDDVRTSTGNSDALPYMPLFEYELLSTIKSLEFLEQNIESYLNELNQRETGLSNDETQSEIFDDDDDEIRDSALDTYSETSSLVEPLTISKDSRGLIPQLMNIPEARSSSSSDDKKTIASSTSPPSSHHGHSKSNQHDSIIKPLAVLQESSPTTISPLQAQIAQIDRQISDEGYRSVQNEQQQTLTRSSSYDSTEKVDKWLLTTTLPPTDKKTEQNHFQATDIVDEDEHQIETVIPVSNH